MKNPQVRAALMFVAVSALTVLSVFAQDAKDNDVVKITTKLVQLDVVVTDKDGNQVPDLTADDFEVLQDSKPQRITAITYVGTAPPTGQPSAVPKKTDKNAIPPPPVKVRPSATSRIITFIVDDGNCGASTLGMLASREGIEKFVREQMLTGDLVAIYRTRAGSSALQQYTSDKAQLLKAAKQIRWLPAFGSCGRDGSFFEAARINTIDLPGKNLTVESERDKQIRERSEDADRNSQMVGSIGVLRYVIRGLDRVPGRKVVFFLSDGIPLASRSGEILSAVDVLRDVTDLANRSSVVVNTIDSRGMIDTLRSRHAMRSRPETMQPLRASWPIAGRWRCKIRETEWLSSLTRRAAGFFTIKTF